MDKKRVELSVHTNMGNTGSVNDTGNLYKCRYEGLAAAIAYYRYGMCTGISRSI